jgi:hypothetical protein
VLSHRDVILNRSLSQLSPQENHLEYHIVSTLTQRRMIHPSHGHTQPLGDDSTLTQRRTMPQPLGDNSTLTHRRTMSHHMGMPNTGLSHRSTQLSHIGEHILEDVSRCCNDQHGLHAAMKVQTTLCLHDKTSTWKGPVETNKCSKTLYNLPNLSIGGL